MAIEADVQRPLFEADTERAELRVQGSGGDVLLDARTVRGRERLGELFSYEVVAGAPARPGLAAELIGGSAELILRADVTTGGARSTRAITGVVSEARARPRTAGVSEVHLTLRPRAWVASIGQDRRVFRDLDAVGIARAVLAGASVPARFEVSRALAVRPYTVQQDESDWAFVLRLLEDEGLYTWFDHEIDSMLVVAEDSRRAPDHPIGARLVFGPTSGLAAADLAIDELGPRRRLRASRFAIRSFDPARPTLGVEGASAAPGQESGLEVYDAPGGGLRDPGEVALRARLAVERARVESEFDGGSASLPHLAPGRAFDLEGHLDASRDRRWLVTSVEVEVDIGRMGSRSHVRFEVVEGDIPFRLARQTPQPRQHGVASGLIVGVAGEEIDVDDAGKARIHHHWDRIPDAASPGRWSRVVQRGTQGSMLLPRVGWNVFAMNEEGAVDAPTIMSRMIDAEHLPPYELPANMTRTTYKTDTSPGGGSSNEIRMEDKKGAEQMYMHASRDMAVEVGDQRNDIVNGTSTKIIAQNQKNDVVSTRDDHVEKDDVIRIAGSWKEKVAIDHSSEVGGNESTKVGGSRKLSTGQNQVTNVSGGRNLLVGAAMIDATLGGIKSVSLSHHELVGGAVIKATPMKMNERVGSEVSASMVLGKLPAKATSLLSTPGVSGAVGALTSKLKKSVGISIQTIGGAKIENTAGNRKLEVKKAYIETTGPAAITGATIIDASGGPFTLTTATLSATAVSKITIESKEKVVIEVGSTVLEVAAATGIRLATKELSLDKADAIGIKAAETKITAK